MKSEGLSATNRSFLHVSDKFICYPVRGTIIRIIDVKTGNKSVLKGHSEHITELHSSWTDVCTLYSSDAGTDNTPHLFFWNVQDASTTTEVESKILNAFTLPVSFLKPHPSAPELVAVANKNNVGIISVKLNSNGLTSYDQLSNKAKLYGDVLGKLPC